MTRPVAALVLAAALLALPGPPGAARLWSTTARPPGAPPAPAGHPGRPAAIGALIGALVWAVTGSVAAGVPVAGVAVGLGLLAHRSSAVLRIRDDDPADLAVAWTQLAVCLEVGLPVSAAVATASVALDGPAGAALRRVAGLLELGADAAGAWAGAGQVPSLAAFARAAGRSAGTGSALARAARAEGERLRSGLVDTADARAQRAAVLITAPLGLCFLPAFLVLGVAPVVIGLFGEAVRSW